MNPYSIFRAVLRRLVGRGRGHRREAASMRRALRKVEHRQWWLSLCGVIVTLLLTLGIVSFSLVALIFENDFWNRLNLRTAVPALVGMVLLFIVYLVYQQLEIYRIRVEHEELFHVIGEHAADMIAVVSVDGQRLYNSPSYEKCLGYTPEELEETSAFEQIHPEDRQEVKSAAEEARTTGVGRRVEYRIRHKNGEWRVLESTASAVRNIQGQVEKLVVVNRDITERKQLEQQLFLSQKLEAVGRLSGGIAHDFNNLLGVIIGYSEALQQKIAPQDPLWEAADEIQKAGHRAAALTQQLLAFSRKQVLALKILDLNAIVHDTDKMLRRLIGEDIQLKTVMAPDLGRVKADRGQVEQVLLNLVVNARDAMPRGGELTIETSNAVLGEADAIRHRYVTPGPCVMLQVTDTGMGMDAEVQSHVFEPFFTTKPKGQGTGLGLATVYGIVKQSGGYIWLESEPGRGSKFKICLPRVEGVEDEVREPADPPRQAQAEGPCVILLVEDEPSLRKLTQRTLAEAGYTVLEAADAPEAIDIANRSVTPIDLLLTDIVMPGKNGAELAAELAPQCPAMKVLFMSGYTEGAVATHGVLKPGTIVLRKPFTRDTLARTVAEVLAKKQPGSVTEESAVFTETHD